MLRLFLCAALLTVAGCNVAKSDVADAVAITVIPTSLRGTWTLGEEPCTSNHPRRIEIQSDRIVFEDGVGITTTLLLSDDGSALLGLAMTGRGNRTARNVMLTEFEDLSRLAYTDFDDGTTKLFSRCGGQG